MNLNSLDKARYFTLLFVYVDSVGVLGGHVHDEEGEMIFVRSAYVFRIQRGNSEAQTPFERDGVRC